MYGTVFFGIVFINAKPIAIKVSNEERKIKFLNKEIDILNKLTKYKIFSKLYEKVQLKNQLYLFETLQEI